MWLYSVNFVTSLICLTISKSRPSQSLCWISRQWQYWISDWFSDFTHLTCTKLNKQSDNAYLKIVIVILGQGKGLCNSDSSWRNPRGTVWRCHSNWAQKGLLRRSCGHFGFQLPVPQYNDGSQPLLHYLAPGGRQGQIQVSCWQTKRGRFMFIK